MVTDKPEETEAQARARILACAKAEAVRHQSLENTLAIMRDLLVEQTYADASSQIARAFGEGVARLFDVLPPRFERETLRAMRHRVYVADRAARPARGAERAAHRAAQAQRLRASIEAAREASPFNDVVIDPRSVFDMTRKR